MTQWIRNVNIDKDELKSEAGLMLAKKSAEDCDEFIESFMNKVKDDIKTRETFNLSRRSPKCTEINEDVPNSYMNTITKYQEFFGLNAEGEPLSSTTNPFECEAEDSPYDKRFDEDEDVSPNIRKSVFVCPDLDELA
mmetsp:Transcript_19441/g.22644  ORF Transcript_19441/g.22644 Transcript_19441/m.22644 type:complete len:137 (-) Transcript_19441:38-448(-)